MDTRGTMFTTPPLILSWFAAPRADILLHMGIQPAGDKKSDKPHSPTLPQPGLQDFLKRRERLVAQLLQVEPRRVS